MKVTRVNKEYTDVQEKICCRIVLVGEKEGKGKGIAFFSLIPRSSPKALQAIKRIFCDIYHGGVASTMSDIKFDDYQ